MLKNPYEFKIRNDMLCINEFVYKKQFQANGVKLGLTHMLIESDMSYDLVISGLYYRMQYKIPFYGDLFRANINGNRFLSK